LQSAERVASLSFRLCSPHLLCGDWRAKQQPFLLYLPEGVKSGEAAPATAFGGQNSITDEAKGVACERKGYSEVV
jgi:hypothetical protein